MAKSKEKIEAINLRRLGYSIKEIARILRVSQSSASIWCSSVKLSYSQIENLNRKMLVGSYKGRIKGAEVQHQKKQFKLENYHKEGISAIKEISNRDLLMLALGLHLGEGNKSGNGFQFTNSNSDIIQLMMYCLTNIFSVNKEQMYFSLIINKIYSTNLKKIKNRWCKILKISSSQFRKTTVIKSKNKKIYDNDKIYLGTLILRIKKSSDLQYKIIGLSQALIEKLNS